MLEGVRKLDLTGQRFGRLVVLREAMGFSDVRWVCQCDCGKEYIGRTVVLRRGTTNSCGCIRVEKSRARGLVQNLRHGEGRNGKETAEYRAWSNMVSRCHNPNHQSFARYGARGIAVCDAWRASYEAFLSDIGRRPSDAHSIDRKDGTKGYEPSNCRWATSTEQNRNLSSNRLVTVAGVTRTLADWTALPGAFTRQTFYARVKAGMTEEQALTTPRTSAGGSRRK